ncbi:Retrovirus-related Pol polyprotein from transposon [Zancudomyces culisetae]|uniref:Retrovirus-related Pol polyprotein from transposon n=1 Tax=Zancudomyces culisetae TaxID=1213189 RepID=A0A1R1PDS9_ZANCU|nr:Retrovirus-related Pol polyprotein from transposon [Zancudomyces culisetae]|eukprot:OMH79079.1 Retrovirus-related Pol polyprotein from transposon [Zancudomyces culisetae]
MNVPKVYEANTGRDPEEWVEKFRLMAKLNKWSSEDWIDFISLYLGNNEKLWYKKNKSDFTSWEIFVKLFVKKFANKRSKTQVWDRLREIKQAEFETVEVLEVELESLLDSAEIVGDSIRADWLVSTLQPKYKKIINEENICGWSEIISRITKEEKDAPQTQGKNTAKEVEQKVKDYNRNAASKGGKPVKEIVRDQRPYGQLIKMFDEMSVNLLNKVEEVVDKRLKEAEHSSTVKQQDNDSEKSVSFIQVTDELDGELKELFAVDKRKSTSELDTENARRPGRPRLDVPSQDRGTGMAEVVIERPNVTSVQANMLTKPFSLISELEKTHLKVSILQLLDSSSSMSKELVEYINKNKISEVNELDIEERKLSNCKALVKVFGQNLWAVVDTGAACSVVSPGLVEGWGLSPDNFSKQTIVTADGKRHTTIGKVSNVPLKISSFTFSVNLWVMDRTEDILILGMDWLMEHRVSLNLRIPELRLPIENAEITTKLATFTNRNLFTEEQELYLLLKEETLGKENNLSEFNDILQEYKDIFVDDISELKQTEVSEQKIELIDETPIKLRPYRMPQQTQEKMLEKPSIFEARSKEDPKEWIDRYRLISKVNKWSDEEAIELIQLYLGKKELAWFKKNVATFKDWSALEKSFCEKFKNKEMSLMWWNRLQEIKLSDYNELDDFESDFEQLILESECTTWKKAIQIITNSDKIEKVIAPSPETKRAVGRQTSIRSREKVVQQREQSGYDDLLKKFEQLSVNLLSKVDQAVDKRFREARTYRNGGAQSTHIKCFKCNQEGHKSYQCRNVPNQTNTFTGTSHNNNVNFIDIVEMDDPKSEEVFAVERRGKDNKNYSPYANRSTKQEVKVPTKHKDSSVQSIVAQRMKDESSKMVVDVEPVNTERHSKDPTQKKAYVVRAAENTPKFTLKEELEHVYPKINLAQLLDVSPALTSEMSKLCRKTEIKELNELTYRKSRTSNCKVQVRIFGIKLTAVIDTGAACSVINPGMLRRLGLQPDTKYEQIIMTADGRKHISPGKVTDVPIIIAEYIFSANLVILDKNEDMLILRTDWLLHHQCTINLKTATMTSPVNGAELIIPIYTEASTANENYNSSEIFLLIKEERGNQLKSVEEIKEITELKKDPDITGRIARWAMLLRNYDYIIQHLPGKLNPADCLSRLVEEQSEIKISKEPVLDVMAMDFLEHEAVRQYLTDMSYPRNADEHFRKKLRNKARHYIIQNGILIKKVNGKLKTVLNEQNVDEVVTRIHNETHEGVENTWIRVSSNYCGAGLYNDVKKIVTYCSVCQYHKGSKENRHRLVPIVATKPFDIVGIDAIGPIAPTTESGNRYILTAIDYFTKYPIAAPVANLLSETIINFIINNIVAAYGVPQQLISDRGTSFLSENSTNVFEWLGIKHTPTTAYRPQSNGQVERLNQTLTNILIKQCKNDKKNWDLYLWKTLLVLRSMRNKSTKYSPSELLYGAQIHTPTTWTYNGEVDNIEEEIQNRIKVINDNIPELRKLAIENIKNAKINDEVTYNKKVTEINFNIGELVLKKVEFDRPKLERIWEGPYKIERRLDKGAYIISDNEGNRDLVHGDRLKRYNLKEGMIPDVSTPLRSSLQRFKQIINDEGIWP